MRMDRQTLKAAIAQIVATEAAKHNIQLSQGAMQLLETIPPDFQGNEFEIDQQKLDDTIARLFHAGAQRGAFQPKAGLRLSGRVSIETDQMRSILSGADCHYLWFC